MFEYSPKATWSNSVNPGRLGRTVGQQEFSLLSLQLFKLQIPRSKGTKSNYHFSKSQSLGLVKSSQGFTALKNLLAFSYWYIPL